MHVTVQEFFERYFTHTYAFCKTLHKGVHVCSLHLALCLYTHLNLVSWYSQCMLF